MNRKFNFTIRKLNWGIIIMFTFFLPFSGQWIKYLISIWLLAYIIEGNWTSKVKSWRNIKIWLPSTVLIINTISILYSSDKSTAFFIIQTQISLLLFALIWTSTRLERNQLTTIINSYILALLVLAFYIFYKMIYLNKGIIHYIGFNLKDILKLITENNSVHIHHSYLSLHFNLGIIFLIDMLRKEKKTMILIYKIILVILFIFSVIVLNSRAALIVLIFIIIYFSYSYFRKLNKWFKGIILLSIIFLVFNIIAQTRLANELDFLKIKLRNEQKVSNLISNGNFAEGLKYWKRITCDSTEYKIIKTKYGNALRIMRNTGTCYWSLAYVGRDVYFNKNVPYKFRFKYRVVKGEGIPFNVGLWINEDNKNKLNLEKRILSIGENWYECESEFRFEEDYYNITYFLNNQLPNTIIDICDIELSYYDTLEFPMYSDQVMLDIRASLWKEGFRVWEERPIFGYGIGDAKEKLLEIYKEKRITKAVKNNLNCHNQFLETATQTGLVGLTVLLLVFAIPLYQSIKKKQELLFLFLMICFINFMFESMLQRLAGVAFFSFWYSFLWFVYYKDEKE